VSRRLPHLSRAHAHVLALWSYGVVLAHTCGMTTVVALLAPLVGASEGTLRQRLREWCYDAQDKRGTHRQAVEVRACFASLLCWVLAWWRSDERRLALVLDASTLSDRFTVLAESRVYRGCAIPVAWKLVQTHTGWGASYRPGSSSKEPEGRVHAAQNRSDRRRPLRS
jgi:hypothetical protein